MAKPTAGDDRRQDVPAPVLQRYDLDPEPALQPTVTDVLEGVGAALEAAVEPAEPQRTAARTMSVLHCVQAASSRQDGAAELLVSLNRLTQDWRAS